MAKEERKWILVNIQSHLEFSSHMLNRDTWTNETVASICRTSYILWQRGHTSFEGKEFMHLYKLSQDDLPLIAIIDPKTGAKLFSFQVLQSSFLYHFI